MRMAELSAAADVPIATIKYYRRERLLPAGDPSAPNQAEYDDSHVERLRLIRALREVADLPIAAIRDVLAAVDAPGRSLFEAVGAAHAALGRSSSDPGGVARTRADAVLDRAGWQVSGSSPAKVDLANALAALEELGLATDAEVLDRYVRAADAVAAEEVAATMDPDAPRDRVVTGVVVGTVLYEHVLTALRRLAQEHHARRRAPDGQG